MADLSSQDLAELRQLYKDLQNISIPNMDAFVKSIGGMDAARKNLEQMRKEFSNIDSDVNSLVVSLHKVLNELKGQNSTLSLTKKAYSNIAGIANQLKYDQDGITRLNKKDLETQSKKLGQEKQRLELAKQLNAARIKDLEFELRTASFNPKKLADIRNEKKALESANSEITGFLEDQENGINSLIAANETRLQKEKEIIKNLGLMGVAYQGIAGILSNIGISSEYIDKMGEDLRDAAEKGKVGFKELFPIIKKGLTEALQDPLVKFQIGLKAFKSGISDIKKGFDIFLEQQKIIVDTSRSLGQSIQQTKDLTTAAKFSNTAFTSNVYSTAQIGKAISEVNSQLGISGDLGADNVTQFAAMTNQMGLSADEAAKIYKLGLLTNQSLTATNAAISSGIIAAQKSTGVQVNARQVFQEIGKLSAGITAKFQQNPEAIAKAVVQAKALGLTLEQTDKIGDSLLNWESSIESELKAELVTGRQLNVERARAAALVGDQVTLMNEVASQVGNLSDFQDMNVIAQKSLAEAFGMSRDEMADMLQKQEVFNKLGDVSGKSAAEQLQIAKDRGLSETDSLMVNLQQQASAEKLAATWDNLKLALANLLEGPLGGIVDAFAWIANHAGVAYGIMVLMGAVSLAKTIGGLLTMAVQLGIISVEAITANAAITFGIGAVVIAAAVGGLLSMMSSSTDEATKKAKSSQSVQDGIADSGRGPFAVTDKFGATAITAKGDKLAVSPNIRQTNASNDDQGSGINAGHFDQFASKIIRGMSQISMNVDGERFGSLAGNQASTGTNQAKNSYQLA